MPALPDVAESLTAAPNKNGNSFRKIVELGQA